MRFAFWPSLKQKLQDITSKPAAAPVTAPVAAGAGPAAARIDERPATGDLDLRAIWDAILRKRAWVIVPTLAVALVSIAAVNIVTPRYKSEARILIDGRENYFLRPNGERVEQPRELDPEAVTSQVQLLLSRDLAREVIRKNKLSERPEFDPVLRGFSPLKWIAALVGIGRDPFSMTPEERVLDAYFERLTAFAVDKSRVVVVEFQSRDPELAERVANSVAEGYLSLQQNARQSQARAAGQWLSGEIDSLRSKVAEAEARVEDFRSKSSLFVGANNTSLSNQQMGEINTQISNARAAKSDAETKARLIREMLQSGRPIEASDVLNSELIRRLSEQRVTLRAQLAEQSSTLLDAHPRIKELKAQANDLDRQIRDEAGKLSRSFENDAKIASGRLEGLTNNLEQLKKQASSSNGQDVQLRALEREAKAQRDLLESYLAKFREANTRENIDAAPSDGRIISRAIVSNTPAFPKKLPIVLIATLATLMLTAGAIATGELLRMTAPRTAMPAPPRLRAAAPSLQPEPVAAADAVGVAGEIDAVREIDAVANELRAAGADGRKITVLGGGPGESVSQTALHLARLLSRDAKVVVVDLSASSLTLSAASSDPMAPGLAELMQSEATFAQIITRDRSSRANFVTSGRQGVDRALLQSPRIGMAIDALMGVYDHVVLDAGTASDLPAALLTERARAVVVPDPALPEDARARMAEQLAAVGFRSVTMLTRPAQADAAVDPEPRVVAA